MLETSDQKLVEIIDSAEDVRTMSMAVSALEDAEVHENRMLREIGRLVEKGYVKRSNIGDHIRYEKTDERPDFIEPEELEKRNRHRIDDFVKEYEPPENNNGESHFWREHSSITRNPSNEIKEEVAKFQNRQNKAAQDDDTGITLNKSYDDLSIDQKLEMEGYYFVEIVDKGHEYWGLPVNGSPVVISDKTDSQYALVKETGSLSNISHLPIAEIDTLLTEEKYRETS